MKWIPVDHAAFIDDSGGNGAGDNPDDDRPDITSISSPTVDL
ncbi:hypothetical protein [Vibrio sp. THAF191d]|nr:hypothetical protein [Vibrio sp. THAF191d]